MFDDGREGMPPKTRIIGRNVIFRNDITNCFNSIRGTILARRNVTLEDMCDVFSQTRLLSHRTLTMVAVFTQVGTFV